ncbi:unnamed protein product, partial [Allacma fusca]
MTVTFFVVYPLGDSGGNSDLVVFVSVSLSAVVITLITVAVCIIRLRKLQKTIDTLAKEEVEIFYFGYQNHEVLLDGNCQAENLAFKQDLQILMENLEI